MYAMAASGSRRKKRTTKVAKKKLPKRRRKHQAHIKKKQTKLIKKRYQKRHPQAKVKHIHLPKAVHTHKAKGLSKAEHQAKEWIAWHESRGRWHVSNGSCYGRYQLSLAYLHGDYSHANQNRAADHYVHTRYGTWQHAKSFWQVHHWY